MTVRVHLYSQSMPVQIELVSNAYQKGDLYCVLQETGTVTKFPLQHVFRIVEINE